MPVTERTYESVALENPDRQWELHRGVLREKPAMTFRHGDVMSYLAYLLQDQLDRAEFRVHINHARVRQSAENYYVPDVVVIPVALARPFWDRSDVLEVYADPLPLVAEVWSPSTGDYDVEAKLLEYQRRGDLEIWRVHPYDRTLKAWQWQPDGSYAETVHEGGVVRPVALPWITIDLDALFE